MPRHHNHTCTHKEARDQISLALIHLIPLADYNIKVLSINQKLIKIWKKKTLFKLARAITDTGTDTVSSKGGTVTHRITSLKRKLVDGKVVSTSTPSCTLGSASVSWATWGGVTVGDGYLDVKINYSENTGYSRSTTLIFTQMESDNKIHLTVTQGYQRVI